MTTGRGVRGNSSLEGQELDTELAMPTFAGGELLLGRYVIERLIARGGMGEVYEARHVQLGKRVALKTLVAAYASSSGWRRFEREARLLAKLDNAHIVSAFDFGCCEDGRLVLVMEYLNGSTLRGVLSEEGSLVTPRAVRLALQICEGLSAAHAAGAVHRDLKPENVFVCRRDAEAEVCKILDFGLVKLRDGSGSLHTRIGAAVGTLRYMSPEQARGDRIVDHRSDIYSVAAILYEMLAGVRPHEDSAEFALMRKVIEEPPQPLHELCAVPRGLSAAVHRALAKDPNERFQSVTELASTLRAYAQNATRQPRDDATRSLPVATITSSVGPTRKVWLSLALAALAASFLLWMGRRGQPVLHSAAASAALAPASATPPLLARQAQATPSTGLPLASPAPTLIHTQLPITSGQPVGVERVPSPKAQRRSTTIATAAAPDGAPTGVETDELSFDRRNPYVHP